MHTIRLRDPWDSTLTPQGWQFSRRFQRPTGLSEREQVFLEIEQVTYAGIVRLNGIELGPIVIDGINRWPISEQLHFRNAILIEFNFGEDLPPAARKVPGTLIGEVRLIIQTLPIENETAE